MDSVHIPELVNSTLDAFSLHHPDRPVSREATVPEVFVQGNRHLLQIALLNILDNAFKYSADKITISFNLERK